MDALEFGQYIKSLRNTAGLTLLDLSKLSQVSHPYISQIENGLRPRLPTAEILSKLAPYLGVPVMNLMQAAGYLPETMLGHDESTAPPALEQFLHQSLHDIEKVLAYDFISYKGVRLSKKDKQKLLDYLDYCLYLKQQKGGK